jgi:uncharacterized Zn finger protein
MGCPVSDLVCEECGNTVQAHFMGHIDRGAYDGVLVWECLECGRIWPRFVDDPETNTRTQASIRFARTLELFRRHPDDESVLDL